MKLGLLVISTLIMSYFSQAADALDTINAVPIILPPCRCIVASLPCPGKDYSHRSTCNCPDILSGSVSKTYWQTGHVFEIGSGPRTDTLTVFFPKSFCRVPFVHFGISMLDSFSGANLRYSLTLGVVTPTYFKVNFNTWADTKLYGLGISYVAYA